MKCFFGSGKFFIFREFGDLLFLWGYSLGCYCQSKEIYFLYPKVGFGHAEFKASFPQALKNCSQVFDQLFRRIGGLPISSTYCARWSALMTGSRYFRKKLENAHRERLSPCANLRYAKVLLAKLNARSLIDCWSAIWRQ